MGKFIILDESKKVVAIRYGSAPVKNEIEIAEEIEVNLGDIMQEDGTFKPSKREPTFEEIRAEYIRKIQEAEILGEFEEAERLRNEWQTIKESYKK